MNAIIFLTMFKTAHSFILQPIKCTLHSRFSANLLHTSPIYRFSEQKHKNQLSINLEPEALSIRTFQRYFSDTRLFSSSTSPSTPSKSLGDNGVHVLRFDGVISTSCPYKAGAGFLLYNVSSGKELLSTNHYLGIFNFATNNNGVTSSSSRSSVQLNAIIAQGKSLLLGMQNAIDLGVTTLVVQGHSPLIQYHLQQQQKDQNDNIPPCSNDINKTEAEDKEKINPVVKEIHQEILEMMNNFDSIQLISIPKGRNMNAFKLAEKAVRDAITIANENLSREAYSKSVSEENKSDMNISNEFKDIRLRDGISIDPKQTFILRFDGGSRGNPGKAGAGFVLYVLSSNGQCNEIYGGSHFMGDSYTNNEAEYMALKKGLQCSYELGIKNLQVEGDSDLVVKQVNGQWKCKKSHLRLFLNDVLNVKKCFSNFKITHIPREQNSRADELANLAMDTKVTKL